MRTITYTRPSTGWLDGLPLGNGRIGAIVLTRPDGVELQLTDGTGWSGSPASEGRHGLPDARVAQEIRERARSLFDQGRVVAAEAELRGVQTRQPQAFLPFGHVRIQHRETPHREAAAPAAGTGNPAHPQVRRSLNLADAVHTAAIGPGVHHSFVTAADGVVVHRVSARDPIDLTITHSSPLRPLGSAVDRNGMQISVALPADFDRSPTDEPSLSWMLDGVEPVTGALVSAWTHDGSAVVPHPDADSPRVDVEGVRELLLVVATGTTFTGVGSPPAGALDDITATTRRRVRAALGAGYTALRDRHVRDHRALFDRVELRLTPATTIEDPDTLLTATAANETSQQHAGLHPALLETLFDYGRYLLVAGSRPGGLPTTLQGLWNGSLEPPWSSAYTLNINTQMNYWPAAPTNLPETVEPLLDFVEALARRGRATAERLYDARGWVCHHNSDAWGFTTPTAGDASWAQWPMGGVWLVCELDRLRHFGVAPPHWNDRLWPVARGAMEFVLDLRGEEHPGQTFPSVSPENRYHTPDGPAALSLSTGMDRYLITALLHTLESLAAATNHADDPLLPRARARIATLEPPLIEEDGTIREWHAGAQAVDPHHRHVSHLTFAYPGTVDLEADEGRLGRAVARSLAARGPESTGWSLAWKLALQARLRNRAAVTDLLALLFRRAGGRTAGLYPNLFAAHPPFQIDGNFGLTAGLVEALVQSHRGRIDLLPALPIGCDSGSFRGLVARPGLMVDLCWSNGRPERVTLRALQPAAAGRYVVGWAGQERTVEVSAHTPTALEW